jgi:hypothetical protein
MAKRPKMAHVQARKKVVKFGSVPFSLSSNEYHTIAPHNAMKANRKTSWTVQFIQVHTPGFFLDGMLVLRLLFQRNCCWGTRAS